MRGQPQSRLRRNLYPRLFVDVATARLCHWGRHWRHQPAPGRGRHGWQRIGKMEGFDRRNSRSARGRTPDYRKVWTSTATKFNSAEFASRDCGGSAGCNQCGRRRGDCHVVSYGLAECAFRALLEAKLGVPAAVDNDVNVAAIAESKIGAARGVRDFVFVALGTGIGAGIVLNGEIFHGMNWSAGEIGYLLVPGTPVTPVETGSRELWKVLLAAKGLRCNGAVSGAKTLPGILGS